MQVETVLLWHAKKTYLERWCNVAGPVASEENIPKDKLTVIGDELQRRMSEKCKLYESVLLKLIKTFVLPPWHCNLICLKLHHSNHFSKFSSLTVKEIL